MQLKNGSKHENKRNRTNIKRNRRNGETIMESWMIGAIITGGVFFLALVGVLLYWQMQRAKWRFDFILWNKDMKGAAPIKGKIIIKKDNKKQKFFAFKHNKSELLFKEPNGYWKGKPVRHISYNDSGEYEYIKDFSLKEQDIQAILDPIERALAMYQLKDNQQKYPLTDKTGLIALGILTLLAVFVMIGLIYTVISVNKTTTANIESLTASQEVMKAASKVSQQTNANLVELGQIVAAMQANKGGETNRVLQPQEIPGE